VDRDLDVIVYGATGFTGRLVAAHLADAAPPDVRWAVAGRSAERLRQVVADLGADVEVLVADSDDAGALRAMAERTRVVATTVGPYARHGDGLVAACADAGTDVCDLTGEAQWIRRMVDLHQATAERTGARIVHCCGFDSIPSDLGVLVAQDAHRERHGAPAPRAQLRLVSARGGVSGGTVASLALALEQAAADGEARRALLDPYSLVPGGVRGSQRTDAVNPHVDPVHGQWVGPFVMAALNAKVVRRTNGLLGFPWGRDFAYDEAVLTGRGPLGAARAVALTAATGVAGLAMALPPTRALALRVLPSPGEGPDEAARERGGFEAVATAVGRP
jgi:short subunit dehydrogenase-like uncharacterized protein